MARFFSDIDDKVVKAVGGGLLVVLVLACGVAAAIAPYLSPLAWKVRPLCPCAHRKTTARADRARPRR